MFSNKVVAKTQIARIIVFQRIHPSTEEIKHQDPKRTGLVVGNKIRLSRSLIEVPATLLFKVLHIANSANQDHEQLYLHASLKL